METKINEFRGHFATPSQEASRVWGGSWMALGRILGGFCGDLGGLIDVKPNKSEGIQANPHAYKIYYKTALPVPYTHRSFF